CDLEVVRHPHRKLADAFAEHAARAQLVAQLPKASEVRAHKLRVLEERREQHQAAAANAAARFERLDERGQLVFARAALGLLAREVNLQEHVQLSPSHFGAHTFESADKRRRINRVNHVEESDGASSLVRLQVADEVPAKRGVLSLQFRDLPFGLLHAVLAEVSEAGGGGFTDETRRVRLADGDECDFARVAVGARRARLDATVHALDARTQTRLLRPGFGTHYCDSVVNGVDYNKRARASATASSEGVL